MSERLRELLSHFDGSLPLERASGIPSIWYCDDELFEAERAHVFGNSWQVAGRVDEVAESGSYLTTNIAGEPVVVVRDLKGTLRAFSNVCRHRAAPVATEPCGRATRLRCWYHGWTYDLEGKLIGVPEFDGVENFSREQNSLPTLVVDTWGPYLFVHLGARPIPLKEHLAPLDDPEKLPDLPRLKFVGRKEYTVHCNWKVYVDNYLDGGYHVNTVHPALASVLDYPGYRTILTGAYTSLQQSPMKRPANAADAGAAAVRSGAAACYWWIYPNFMMNSYSGVMDTNLVVPVSANECRVVFDFFFDASGEQSAAEYVERSIAVADQIQDEDCRICEQVQRGIGSARYSSGRFSVRRETGAYYFHQLVARSLRAGLKAGGD